MVRFFNVIAVGCLFAAVAQPAVSQRPQLPEGDPARTWKESDSHDGRWNQTDIGPFLASVLPTPAGTIAKGLSIKVGENAAGNVCYDTASGTMRAAWTGGFVKFNPRRYGITSSPTIGGKVQFVCAAVGWGKAKVAYRGLWLHENRVVLGYRVNGTEIQESPWAHSAQGVTAFTRTFHIAPHEVPLSLALFENPGEHTDVEQDRRARYARGDRVVGVAVSPAAGVSLQTNRDAVVLRIEPNEKPVSFQIAICQSGKDHVAANDKAVAAALKEQANLMKWSQPGNLLWPKWLPTGGALGKDDAAYVVDTIAVPFDNPYQALMFCSGLDFLSSGDIAVSTLHGDVWLVRGVGENLDNVRWKRYATGLCQPMGLRIVDDKVYVLGKDQITRLHDRNNDDEADYYECFNNGGATSLGGHDFASCLETGPEGNFYYIRAHQGVCRVSKDGRTHESIATGFRNPIGLGVSPQGIVTAAPQEGNWTPSSCICEIKQGGYYGYAGPKTTSARPLGYDPPLCWMPRAQDNSSGGQVWVTGDRWGPLKGQMLHLSYGMCGLISVLREEVAGNLQSGTVQGGTVRFPLTFESGALRGRFNPRDGQLYVCGLMGWQTAAAKDGCLQRVRYTGKPVDMPVELHVRPRGIAVTFTRPLDERAAADADNYYIEQWNYRYTKDYGSKEYKVSDPKRFGRDEVFIDEATLQDDGRTVYLELEEIQPVMQMRITYQIKAADGTPLKQTIYNTIHHVPPK